MMSGEIIIGSQEIMFEKPGYALSSVTIDFNLP